MESVAEDIPVVYSVFLTLEHFSAVTEAIFIMIRLIAIDNIYCCC